MMSATVSVIAIPVLENIRVSNVDGAWVEPSATEVLEKLFSNVVDSKLEHHSTSLAQLISEPQIARVTPVIGEPNNAQKVIMVNSQML